MSSIWIPGATFGSVERCLHWQVATDAGIAEYLVQLLKQRQALLELNFNQEEARWPKRISAVRFCHISYGIVFLFACIWLFLLMLAKKAKTEQNPATREHQEEQVRVGVLTLASYIAHLALAMDFIPFFVLSYICGFHIFFCLSYVMLLPAISFFSFFFFFAILVSASPSFCRSVLILLWMRNLFALNLDVRVSVCVVWLFGCVWVCVCARVRQRINFCPHSVALHVSGLHFVWTPLKLFSL